MSLKRKGREKIQDEEGSERRGKGKETIRMFVSTL